MKNELESLYRKEKSLYVSKMLRYVDNRMLAEDIVQNAFLTALIKIDQYDPKKSKMSTWLNSILFSHLWDWKRKNKKTPNLCSLDDFVESDSLLYVEDSVYFPLEKIRNPSHKLVASLYFISGYNMKGVSELTGYTLENVKKIVQRVREVMKDADF